MTRQDIAEKGAVILWPAADSTGRPPPGILRQFPDLAVEVPRSFDRQFQGRMPLMRVADELSFAYPDLSDELKLVNIELRAGKARTEALRNLGDRTGLNERDPWEARESRAREVKP